MPTRGPDGMEIPILYASVPPMPTVKSLAGVMLAALNAPDCERGTENEKSRRLRILMKETGTRVVMIDEFQHFYDRGKAADHAPCCRLAQSFDRRDALDAGCSGAASCRVVINETTTRQTLHGFDSTSAVLLDPTQVSAGSSSQSLRSTTIRSPRTSSCRHSLRRNGIPFLPGHRRVDGYLSKLCGRLCGIG